MACFENFSSNFFSNFNISYTIPMENVENVNIFYGKVNFKSQIINFNFYFLYISNAKIKWMCYWSRLHFLRFWDPFLKHLVKISDAFKLDILREKLISYKNSFLEGVTYFHQVLQKRVSKTRFFYFIIFWKLKIDDETFKSKFSIFTPIQFQWKNRLNLLLIKIAFFAFCCPFLKHLV